MRRRLSFFLIAFLSGCSSGPVPNDILPPARMQKVVYDLIRIDEFINNFLIKDSTINLRQKRAVFYEQIFKANHVTRKEFYTSYKYYQQHPKVQKALFDSLNEALNRIKPDTVKKQPPNPVH